MNKCQAIGCGRVIKASIAFCWQHQDMNNLSSRQKGLVGYAVTAFEGKEMCFVGIWTDKEIADDVASKAKFEKRKVVRMESAAPRPDAGEGHAITVTETDTQLLRAFTPERYAGFYPWYWNLTMVRMKGDVVLTVRLPTAAGKPAGVTSSVRFTREMWRTLMEKIEEANKIFKACDENDAML